MPDLIIADTSCLIILSKIGELNILQDLYGTISTTDVVAEEFGETLPYWMKIKSVSDKDKQKLLELQIDKGEASAIALALELRDCKVILDDFKARKVALELNIDFTGTLGIIIKAKNKGLVPSIKPFLDKIKNTNFRISPELELIALKEANE